MSLKLATKALHAGHDVKQTQGTRAVPIYQSTSYVFNDSDHAANLFSLSESGYIYTRLNNPTNDVLEQRLASVEGGVAAVATASGTSAIATTFMTLLKSGDHIVASNSLYGGTYNMLKNTLPSFGITTTFVDPDNVDNFKDALKANTKVFFAESLGNPKLDVIDLEGITNHARDAKVLFIVDNTIASPALLNPIEHGANIVIHSLTKYITGNGTTLGGIIIDAGTFDYSSGRFPEFTEPSPSYHGLKYHEALGPLAFIAKTRVEGLRDLGSAPSPLNSFQVIQGLETLEVRMQKHSENALNIAKWLEEQSEVSWVNYPGLNSSKYNQLAKKYLKKGSSGIVTFGLKKGYEGAKKVAESTKIFALLANIGDTKSLIIHPSSTTHSQLNIDEQKSTGVTPDLIRISVGIENLGDLKEDLKQSFAKI